MGKQCRIIMRWKDHVLPTEKDDMLIGFTWGAVRQGYPLYKTDDGLVVDLVSGEQDEIDELFVECAMFTNLNSDAQLMCAGATIEYGDNHSGWPDSITTSMDILVYDMMSI